MLTRNMILVRARSLTRPFNIFVEIDKYCVKSFYFYDDSFSNTNFFLCVFMILDDEAWDVTTCYCSKPFAGMNMTSFYFKTKEKFLTVNLYYNYFQVNFIISSEFPLFYCMISCSNVDVFQSE